MKPSDLTVCWIDNGLFTAFASHIAPQFKKSYYWTPWVSGFPTSNSLLPGDGLEGLIRIKYWEDVLDETDLFIFPDVYFGPLQELLVKMGKRVWGGRRGDSLELQRWKTKGLMHKLGMPLANAVLITGLDKLRDYLKNHDNVFVKISTTRGDMETWHSETYDLSETRLTQLEQQLGAKSHIAQFVVEDAIDDAVETGFDGWTIDGQFPKTGMAGIEIKDQGYIIAVRQYDELPEQIRFCNTKLAPFLKEHQYRGFYSTEIRVTEKDLAPYLIDPCCRCGSPPNEIYQNLFDNWGEILWEGAAGQIVEPKPIARFGVEALMHSSFADENWQPIFFPEEIRPFVKLRNHCQIDGKDYIVPQSAKLPEVGAVIGLGDTLEEAIEHLNENAEQVQGYYLEIKIDAIPKALEEIRRMDDIGIPLIPAADVPQTVNV